MLARVPGELKREAEELLDAMGLKARKADLTRCPAQRRKAESKHIKI